MSLQALARSFIDVRQARRVRRACDCLWARASVRAALFGSVFLAVWLLSCSTAHAA